MTLRNRTLVQALYVLHHFCGALMGVDCVELGWKRCPREPFIITRVPNTTHGIKTQQIPPRSPTPQHNKGREIAHVKGFGTLHGLIWAQYSSK